MLTAEPTDLNENRSGKDPDSRHLWKAKPSTLDFKMKNNFNLTDTC